MNYYYNKNNTNNQKNRQERRKNGERGAKKQLTVSDLSHEQLEKILKTELTDLINQPYSESLKRERYQRLEPLIEEYKRQQNSEKQGKSNSNNKTKNQSKANVKNIPDSVKIYNAQKSQVQNMPVYQKLNNPANIKPVVAAEKNVKTQKAISAYQTQMSYSKSKSYTKKYEIQVVKQPETVKQTVKKAKAPAKKGFFDSVFLKSKKLKKQPVKRTVVKPTTIPQNKRLAPPTPATKSVTNHVYNEFEKALRDMNRYQKETGYRYYRQNKQINNGYRTYNRQGRFEPRYL